MRDIERAHGTTLKNAWKFLAQEDGQDIAEYTLILSLIVCVCVSGVSNVGTMILHGLQNVCNAL